MPLLTELGGFFSRWFYKDAAPTGLIGRAPETFLVSVTMGGKPDLLNRTFA